MIIRRTAICLGGLLLAACASERIPAPVVERTRPAAITPAKPAPTTATATGPSRPRTASDDPRPKSYSVKKGDTLYGIALENGLDYKDLAAWNQLADVNLIKVDQALRLGPPDEDTGSGVVIKPLDGGQTAAVAVAAKPEAAKLETVAYPKAIKFAYNTDLATVERQSEGASETKPVGSPPTPVVAPVAVTASTLSTAPKPVAPEPRPAEAKPTVDASTGEEEVSTWGWPTTGKVITPFSDGSKGIDITGKLGQPVLAAASGKVVYAGTGLRGYGKLVIIKHNKTYLSAYAHNSQLLVKEGDTIKKGDKIAEMGNTDAEQIKLHFEIRRFGKPVDPNKYLTADKS